MSGSGSLPIFTLRVLAASLALSRRLRVHDDGRLSRVKGPLILISNHGSRLDSLYYHHAVGVRLTICGARAAYFSNARRRAVMRLLNVRPAQSRDRFVDDCCRLLASGQVLLLFPEMQTNPDGLGEFKDWAAAVSLQSGTPVLPCAIAGSAASTLQAVSITVGQPVHPTSALDANQLSQHYRELIVQLWHSTPR